ncbi:MAG: hypothetical protein ABR68_02315, partial [Microbacteriaceae bacterium BACL28 MAG-120531-bin53]
MIRLPGARLRKAQIATLATFIAMGHAALSSVAWVPEYIARLDVSFATWGTIIGFGVIGSITPLLFASRLIMRFGSRAIIRFSNYGAMVFLVTLAFSSDPLVWFFLNASFGFFISLMGVSVNASAVMLQKQISINVMGRMHAGWSLGAVAAAISGGLATVYLSLEIYLLIVGVVTLIIFEFNLRWLLSPTEDGHLEEKANTVKRRIYQMPAELRLLAVGLFFGIYPEVAIIDWAAVFAKDVLNADVALRSVPFAAFMTGMIIGRLSMTRLARVWHPHTMASRGAFLAAITLSISALTAGQLASFNPEIGLIATGAFWGLAGLGLLSMTRLARVWHPHTMASRGAFLAAITLSISALTAGQLASFNPEIGLIATGAFWGLAGLGLAPVSPAFYSAAGHIPGVSTAWAVSSLSLFNAVISIVAKTV